MAAAEGDVGDRLGQADLAEQLALGADAVHAVARTGPDVAVLVAAEPVRRSDRGGVERAGAAELRHGRVDHVEGQDLALGGVLLEAAGLGDVEPALVGGEAQPVRALEGVADHAQLAGARIEPVDVAGQLLGGALALVVHHDAVVRIGEPDRAVRLHHHVVRRVQPLPLVALGEHGDAAVMLGAHHRAGAVQARDQPAFLVPGVAVGEVARLAVDRDALALDPAQDAVVGDVAEQQAVGIAEPHRPLGPAAALGEPLQRRVVQDVACEALVDDLEVAHRLSAPRCGRRRRDSRCWGRRDPACRRRRRCSCWSPGAPG